jgi:hypothetical protein
MKILLTGHTSNIGKEIAKHYQKHEIIGVSRATGYDLTKQDDLLRIVDLAKDVDCFINLANVGISQSILLYAVHKSWKAINHTAKIISFGTLATAVPVSYLADLSLDLNMVSNKLLLDKLHAELCLPVSNSQSTIIRFANYGSKSKERANEPVATSKQITNVLDYILFSDVSATTIDFY